MMHLAITGLQNAMRRIFPQATIDSTFDTIHMATAGELPNLIVMPGVDGNVRIVWTVVCNPKRVLVKGILGVVLGDVLLPEQCIRIDERLGHDLAFDQEQEFVQIGSNHRGLVVLVVSFKVHREQIIVGEVYLWEI